jgi:transcriptional regulator with XRE-family HTH domain
MSSPVIQIRKTLGMTQTDFGKKMGLSRTMIDNYEHQRKSPSYRIILILKLRIFLENNLSTKSVGKCVDEYGESHINTGYLVVIKICLN